MGGVSIACIALRNISVSVCTLFLFFFFKLFYNKLILVYKFGSVLYKCMNQGSVLTGLFIIIVIIIIIIIITVLELNKTLKIKNYNNFNNSV